MVRNWNFYNFFSTGITIFNFLDFIFPGGGLKPQFTNLLVLEMFMTPV